MKNIYTLLYRRAKALSTFLRRTVSRKSLDTFLDIFRYFSKLLVRKMFFLLVLFISSEGEGKREKEREKGRRKKAKKMATERDIRVSFVHRVPTQKNLVVFLARCSSFSSSFLFFFLLFLFLFFCLVFFFLLLFFLSDTV